MLGRAGRVVRFIEILRGVRELCNIAAVEDKGYSDFLVKSWYGTLLWTLLDATALSDHRIFIDDSGAKSHTV